MAVALGMPAERVANEMTYAELCYWDLWLKMRPELRMWHTFFLAQSVARMLGAKKDMKPEDWYPSFEKLVEELRNESDPRVQAERQKRMIEMMVNAAAMAGADETMLRLIRERITFAAYELLNPEPEKEEDADDRDV